MFFFILGYFTKYKIICINNVNTNLSNIHKYDCGYGPATFITIYLFHILPTHPHTHL